jgi:hypothetical protein
MCVQYDLYILVYFDGGHPKLFCACLGWSLEAKKQVWGIPKAKIAVIF